MTVDRYRLLRRLGAGGTAEVWEAELMGPQGFRKPVAIKLRLDPEPGAMLEEARVGASLHHPNLVGTWDRGRQGVLSWVVMELVAGPTTADLRKRGRLQPEQVLDIGQQACSALHHLHGMGLVHGDVKPANLIISDSGVVKLADLGLTAPFGTRGASVGTPGFCSPEQALHQPLGPASDLFSLGSTLAALAVGRPPFGRGTRALATIGAGVLPRGLLVAADTAVPGLGVGLARCWRRRPEDRWPSAVALRRYLTCTMGAPSELSSKPMHD